MEQQKEFEQELNQYLIKATLISIGVLCLSAFVSYSLATNLM